MLIRGGNEGKGRNNRNKMSEQTALKTPRSASISDFILLALVKYFIQILINPFFFKVLNGNTFFLFHRETLLIVLFYLSGIVLVLFGCLQRRHCF